MSERSSYEVYKEAQARINAKIHDYRDEVVVALWKKTGELLGRCKELEKVLDENARFAAQSFHTNDIEQTRKALADGQKFDFTLNF